ncbi:MAG: DUF305 domain-containing protein [Caldilineaceae bacterium]|nr:DUF305 domain-containing protein [Caldilineaceae bacterium]
MNRLNLFLAAGATVLVVAGCAGVMPAGNVAGADHSAMATVTPTTGMDHRAMHGDPSAPFDAQFIDSMIEHHQGAIDMAEQVLAESERPELRDLAEAIIAAQAGEIEEMTAWRQAWYPDLPATGGMDMGMGDMEISADESKPFDQRFLEAMISHHQGAIDMAKMAQEMAEREEIQTLAAAIIAAQEAEIEQMRAWLAEWFGESNSPSPYASQVDSPIRGLSAAEIDDLLAGRGMGYARSAELNGYPGPLHLLELKQELNLSGEQVNAISAIFAQMQAQAQQLGEEIVRQEGTLSAAFAAGEISETEMVRQVITLAERYGELRAIHLRAHLLATPLLTEEQISAYNVLRGYTPGAGHTHGHGMHD